MPYTTQDFDITELSASSHLLTSARGDSPYVGIPAFVSRSFRHSSFYIRTDRGVAGPADLKEKRIGVPQYQQTAALWARGLLADEYGVQASEINWRNGGLGFTELICNRSQRAPLCRQCLPQEIWTP
ncbi:MAG: hypothetical protein WDN29_15375 [Methylovirgula sp.]